MTLITMPQTDVAVDEDTSASPAEPKLVAIALLSIPDVIEDYDDATNYFTFLEQTTYTATGTAAIPDLAEPLKIRMLFMRTDNGRTVSMPAIINVDGSCSVELNFPTRGQWTTNTKLLNSKLATDTFEIETYYIEVM